YPSSSSHHPAPPATSPLSLHDALPILFTPPEPFDDSSRIMAVLADKQITHVVMTDTPRGPDVAAAWRDRLDPFDSGLERCVEQRSEEHTSELQSRGHLVCRLLLEKKKK